MYTIDEARVREGVKVVEGTYILFLIAMILTTDPFIIRGSFWRASTVKHVWVEQFT